MTDDTIAIERAPMALPASDYLAAHPPRYTLRACTALAQPLDEVFAFFADAGNLAAITPPDLGFAIVTPRPIAMAAGTIIDYRIRALRLPMRWRTRIDVWEPRPPGGGSARFVDAQLRGPYACWWHEHRFTRAGTGTIMEDTVHYAPPLGPLGRVANHLIVARELRRIFSHRSRVIRERFPST